MKQIHYFYKITNLINGKFYYGIRTCNCLPGKDSYMGSGTYLHRAFRKYGIQNFKKEILRVCKTREDASDLERWIVTEELIKSPMCYNIRVGGDCPESYYGGVRCYTNGKYSVVPIDKYRSGDYISVMKGKVYAIDEKGAEILIDCDEARNRNLELANCYLKKDQVIAYDTVKGWYSRIDLDEYYSNKDRYKMPSELNKMSSDTKKKISNSMKELVKNGKNDHLKVRKWMTNGIDNKRVMPNDVDTYLSNGWKFGKTKK